MKRSELIAAMQKLFGNEDVDIFFQSFGEHFTTNFRVVKDDDGDAVIKV